MKNLLLTLLFALNMSIMFSQTQITGIVKDNFGVALPGASVLIKGTTFGVTTDLDGNFSFSANSYGMQLLQVSFIGFKTSEQTIFLSEKTINLAVVLEAEDTILDAVVLTASSTFRSQKNTPMSITSLKSKDITKLSANSQADILRGVPGVTVEGGGGEVATNLFIRGLPSGGQYVFNPLMYDGVPLMGVFGLNSSAHDVYARPDIGFRGVEFVRGGASILFGPGSVAGMINYISKTGDTNSESIINVENASRGRIKTEFYTGGQLGAQDSNTYYAVTGFIRKDKGPIETGLDTRGFQLRGNVKKKIEHGSITLHGQFINDRVQFFLPLPLDGKTRKRLPGNDGDEVEQLLSGELANTSFLTPGGFYKSPIDDGVYTKGGYFLVDVNYNLTDDLKFTSKLRYASYEHKFALYVGGNGSYGNPLTLTDYVAAVAPNNSGYIANYQGEPGNQISGSNLVVENLHIDRLRPMTDYSGEANLVYNTPDGNHTFTGGMYLARTEAEDVNYQYRVLSEFNNNPRLVNLSYTNANGENVVYSLGGLYDRIGMTSNRFLTQSRTAFYFTDEMKFNKWRLDLGFRLENTKGTFRNGGLEDTQVYENPELTPNLSMVRLADGSFTTGKVDATGWAVFIAGLYELSDATNLYANFSKGYFIPLLRGFTPTPGIRNTPYDMEQILQGEVGAKFETSKFSGTLAAFHVNLSDRVKIVKAIVEGELIDQARSTQATKTFGLEATGSYSFTDVLSAFGTFTYQDHAITENLQENLVDGTSSEANVGNKLARQPNILGALGLRYDNKKFDALFSVNHTGSKFTDDTNGVALDPISIFRLGLGYTFVIQNDNSLRLGISAFNLFDSDGLSEGNPRAGIKGQSDDGAFFFGRPILPQRFFLTATLNF